MVYSYPVVWKNSRHPRWLARSLRDIQYVDLTEDNWTAGIETIARAIGLASPSLEPQPESQPTSAARTSATPDGVNSKIRRTDPRRSRISPAAGDSFGASRRHANTFRAFSPARLIFSVFLAYALSLSYGLVSLASFTY